MNDRGHETKDFLDIERMIQSMQKELDSKETKPSVAQKESKSPDKTHPASIQTPLFQEMTAQLTGQLSLKNKSLKSKEPPAIDQETSKKKLQEFLDAGTQNIYSSTPKESPDFLKDVTTTIHKQKLNPDDVERFRRPELTEKQIIQFQQLKRTREERAKRFQLEEQQTIVESKPPLYDEQAQEILRPSTAAQQVDMPDSDDLELRTMVDKPQVEDYLKRFKKSSKRITIALAALSLVAFLLFALNLIGLSLPAVLTPEQPLSYLFLFFAMTVAAMVLSKDIILSGLKSLFSRRANRDSAPTMAIVGCFLQIVVLFIGGGAPLLENSNVFLLAPVGIFGLFFSYLGRYMLATRAMENFEQILTDDYQKHICSVVANEELASAFTRGTVHHRPVVGYNRSTQFVEDFMYHSFLDDLSDRISVYFVPVGILIALALGGLSFYISQSIFVAATAFAALLCIVSPFSLLLTINGPLKMANRALKPDSACILGYDAAEQFGDLNAVMLEAQSLFPKGTAHLSGMRVFNHHPIDQSILDAASILHATNSILRDMFMQVLLDKKELLKPVDSVLLEDGLGISAWVDDRHVIIGSRQMAENHNVIVPSIEEEKKLCPPGSDIVYVALSGELAAAFVFTLQADQAVAQSLVQLLDAGIYLVVQTVDPVVTAQRLEEIFGIDREEFKILPARFHAAYRKQSAPTQAAGSPIINDGSLFSYIHSVIVAKKTHSSTMISTIFCLTSVVLGVLLLILFAASNALANFSTVCILAYELVWFAAISIIPLYKQR